MHIITPHNISEYILSTFSGIVLKETWGEKAFFYNPGNLRAHGAYFCTLKEQDGENDSASALNRNGVFRFNFGISKQTFTHLFGSIPKRPLKGTIISGDFNFTQLDVLLPHPIYGWMGWVAILNPSEKTFGQLEVLLCESYQLAVQRYTKI